MVDIAADYHVGIVGYVPGVVPGFGIVCAHFFQIIHPADDGAAVRMGLISDGIHLFEQFTLRLIVGAHASLLHHHLDLLGKLIGRDIQMAHAVSLKRHHVSQAFLGNLLEIGGVILAGKGIVASASGGDPAVELTGADLRRPFEHHVFKHMSDAGLAIDLIHAADTVPDHLDNSRGAAVFIDDHAQAILQRGFIGVGVDQWAECQQGHGQEQTGKSHGLRGWKRAFC